MMGKGIIVMLALLLSTKHVESMSNLKSTSQAVLQNASIEQGGCPPWFAYNSETGNCECQRSPGTDNIVKCTEQGALLRYGFCMTYEKGQGTFVGRCQNFKVQGHNVSETSPGFISLPANISELNQYMCGPMNRKGLVCSECIESFGPAATFYGFSCSSCTNPWFILLYLFIEFVPITIFYLIILVFRVGLTSSPFTAFVLFSQFAVTAVTAAFGPYSFETSPVIYYFSVVISFYGFWNLDFFRFLIPPFCVSSSLQVIHIVFLGYISAFYPLILIGITWICIKLHSRNFKAFVWMWNKLDKHIFKHTKRESKSTIIDVFSTFLLLSYTKILEIFVDTIEPDFILNINDLPTRRVLLVDPSIEWFGIENVPYLIVSFILFIVIIFPPVTLLALYPTKIFRSLLLKCFSSGHTRVALNIFVEKFYDSYRDGLDGERDMRALASLYFILRIFVYLISIAEEFLLYDALLIGGVAIFVALIRPYKKMYMNVIDVLLLADLSFCLVMLDLYFSETLGSDAALFYALCVGVIGSVPMWGFLGYITYRIVPFKRIFAFIKLDKLKLPLAPSNLYLTRCCRKAEDSSETSNDNTIVAMNQRNTSKNDNEDDYELPDRMVNPENYDRDVTISCSV